MQSGRTGLAQELLQKHSFTTQEAQTTLVGESPFFDLHATKIMTNSVKLTHGFGRVKFGTALRGLGRVDAFGSVLDVQQVYLDQPGLNKSYSEVCVAGCRDKLHGKGISQSSSCC